MGRRSLVSLVLVAILLAGCGNERSAARKLDARPTDATNSLDYPAVGLSLELPEGFTVERAKRPGVFRAASGSAALSAFAYNRREELPGNQRELEEALERLEKAAKERSSSFELSESRTLEVSGARAIELLGRQTISKSVLRTRSLHIFKGEAEYVIELLAPPEDFDRLDERVSELIRSSLEITGDVPPARGASEEGNAPL
ncbi:MAG: hypothetical protein M3356_05000 [Actinomycetota bacterium]|nr:hypothetical protein [Actinomycetota bacterium]